MTSVGIVKTASYLPSKINTNAEVCKHVEGLTEDWIIEKTGIKRRFHVHEKDDASFLASMVAISLISQIDIEDLGLIILASFSQDYMFPPMSVAVHKAINAPKTCQIIDINVNCVGLVTGTTMAVERMYNDEKIKYAIVIGVELLSRYIDKKDKFTAPFFSDGASGVLLGRTEGMQGYVDSYFFTDSSVYEEVKLERGKYIYQNGKTTWTQAITHWPYVLKELVKRSHLSLRDIDFFIFHQANKVMIDYIMDKNKIPREKTFTNVQKIGNTGAASIGIAFDEAMKKGLIKEGNLVILSGVGAGFNYGANLWKM